MLVYSIKAKEMQITTYDCKHENRPGHRIIHAAEFVSRTLRSSMR